METPASVPFTPPVGARLHLPAGAPRRFVLFADAEEEFDWSQPLRRDATATDTVPALRDATERLNAMGVVPGYLCDYPTVANERSASIFREMAAQEMCDIGTQLHPWVNPPFEEDVCAFASFTGNLPVELQQAKLIALTDRIEAAIGIRPTVYRAGRYGIGAQSMELLAAAGYRMDVSVRARFDYSDQHGPDYSTSPIWPWRTAEGLVELPLTTGWTGRLRQWPRLNDFRHLRGALARCDLLARVPLTPEGVPLADTLAAIDALYEDGHEIFSLSFHTPSVVPGHTPYVRSDADLRVFWAWWDGVLNRFAKLGIEPARYGDILALLDQR